MRRPFPGIFLGLLVVLAGHGCRPDADQPLPSEDDLYAYSRAVARQARAKVPEEEALAIFHEGRVEQRFGLEDAAIALYRRALEQAPNLVEAYVQIGFILSQRNERHPEAIEAYQQALRIDPKFGSAYTRIALIYMHQNKLDEAERALREELRLGTQDATTYYTLGQTLALQKRHADAVDALRQSLKMDASNRMVYYALSQSLLSLGQKEESQKQMEKFRELKKAEDDARVDPTLGSSNRAEQLKWTAETWLDVATLALGAMNKSTDLARRAQLEKDFVHAAKEALRFDDDALGPREYLMSFHRSRGELEKAAALCEEALQRTPTKDMVLAAFEIVHSIMKDLKPSDPAAAGRSDVSLHLLREVVKVAPTLADGHRELASLILFFKPGNKELLPIAMESAAKAVELDPSAQNYDILGFALLMNGRPQQAREKLEEGIRAHPEAKHLQDRLAKFLERYR